MRFLVVIVCFLLPAAQGEIIDRLAIAVGNQIVTQLQLDEELRVTAMLNHKPVERSLEERRAAADRLVEQLLIKFEMQLNQYTLPDKTEVDRYFQQIEDSSGGPAELQKTLQSFNLTADVLRSHLELQLTELKFIEARFRPDVTVSDVDVESAYQKQAAAWKLMHTGQPPTLEASREPLRAMLVEERIDSALNSWLAEDRKRVTLIYFDKTLQ